MKSISVKGSMRTDLGKKGTKKLRAQNQIPCVMYGGGEVVHFNVHENAVKDVIYTPNVYLIELDLDGKAFKAVLKDLQFHPVSDKVTHIDFIEVVEGKAVQVALPVQITGNSVGLRNGGKLRLNKRYLKIKGALEVIPENLEIDITKLNIGQVIKVQDLSFDGLELLDTEKDLVVGVVTSRLAAKGTTDEDEDAAEEGEAAASEE